MKFLLLPALLVLAAPVVRSAGDESSAMEEKEKQPVSAADALKRLEAGSRRFAEGKPTHKDFLAGVRATAAKQTPFAAVLGCMDSRVAPELVFDQGIGDLFSIRVAGNVVDEDALGSLEYAAKVVGVRLILVLGHTHCGAIKGACDNVQLGNLTALVSRIQPAVANVPSSMTPRTSKNDAFVEAVGRENVLLSMRALTERSPVLADLVRNGQLQIAGAIYDVETGKTDFLR